MKPPEGQKGRAISERGYLALLLAPYRGDPLLYTSSACLQSRIDGNVQEGRLSRGQGPLQGRL